MTDADRADDPATTSRLLAHEAPAPTRVVGAGERGERPGDGSLRLEHIDDDKCRLFQEHLEIVGRKWSSGILLAGVRGATRFGEYRAMVTGISDRLLARRLRELEAEGLIERTVTPTTPVLIQYSPTERGRSLLEALSPLVVWAIEHYDGRRPAVAAGG